eukprot:jgi/Galph1/2546/GphlegSOOS_G1229.1
MKLDIQALLFDCDGVLADTEKDGHRVSFNKAFEYFQLNTHWDVDTYGRLLKIGGGKERLAAYWDEVGWPQQFKQQLDNCKSKIDIVRPIHEKKTDIFMHMLQQGEIPLREGIDRLMREATKIRKVQVAVCSTSVERAVKELVKQLFEKEIAEKIAIFAGDQVQKKKPAPDIYQLALRSLRLDPQRCLVVEDSNVGLRAAKAAGLACVVTKSYYSRDEDFSLADAVYESAASLDWSTLENIK